MGKLVVFENITLDGVIQAPARPDEDLRSGFEYGGWAIPYYDAVMASVAQEGMSHGGALLLGRRTYEDFYSVWPNRTDNPFSEVLNNSQKYVASTSLIEPLPWVNSTLLKGSLRDAVAEVKESLAKDLVVLGSGVLVQSLMRHNLVDEFVLQIHPLLLRSGHRLFADGTSFASLRLIETRATTTGVVIATYRTAL